MANNPIIGRWKKQPMESLRYEVDWSKWLIPGEFLTGANVFIIENTTVEQLEITAPFFLESMQPANCVFFLRGGLDGTEYQVTHRVTTSTGQIAEREIIYDIVEV